MIVLISFIVSYFIFKSLFVVQYLLKLTNDIEKYFSEIISEIDIPINNNKYLKITNMINTLLDQCNSDSDLYIENEYCFYTFNFNTINDTVLYLNSLLDDESLNIRENIKNNRKRFKRFNKWAKNTFKSFNTFVLFFKLVFSIKDINIYNVISENEYKYYSLDKMKSYVLNGVK